VRQDSIEAAPPMPFNCAAQALQLEHSIIAVQRIRVIIIEMGKRQNSEKSIQAMLYSEAGVRQDGDTGDLHLVFVCVCVCVCVCECVCWKGLGGLNSVHTFMRWCYHTAAHTQSRNQTHRKQSHARDVRAASLIVLFNSYANASNATSASLGRPATA
jgi:hypothetical protein